MQPDNAGSCADCSNALQPTSGAVLRRGGNERYDGQGEVIPLYRKHQWLLYWDWLLRFWIYFDTISHAVAWLSCAGFVFGELCYTFGAFAGDDTNTVVNEEGNCMGDAFDWMVTFPYLLGDLCWLPSAFCMVFEAFNHDFEARYEHWYMHQKEATQPRYQWVGIRWRCLDWWGAVCYFAAVLVYNIDSISGVVHDCTYINATVLTWTTSYMLLIGGTLFLVGGAFNSMATVHPWLLPGILLPYKKKDWTSLTWWCMWTHWWAGVLFFMTGLFAYWNSPVNPVLSTRAYHIQNSFGFGLGAMMFHVGGVMMLARQSRQRCRPSIVDIEQA